jgi:hypothetical protein
MRLSQADPQKTGKARSRWVRWLFDALICFSNWSLISASIKSLFIL